MAIPLQLSDLDSPDSISRIFYLAAWKFFHDACNSFRDAQELKISSHFSHNFVVPHELLCKDSP